MNIPARMLVSLGAVVGMAAASAQAQDVKCEKYKLPNGMTVILHEDHSLPSVTLNTWYRVGAQDEPPGRSGFAHLFEHLMFMGTARVPGNQFDIIMETGGGANNASTDLHRTNYFSWGPSSLLPTLLWLDADRLEDMGNDMTKEKLDKQRDVVRNELRQSVENSPYGKADEMVNKLLYPPTHPYYNGVIGTHEDLEAANVTNVKDFFATFYVPNNASMVIAGDFDSAKIKPLVAQLFGTIREGAPITRKYERPTEPIPLHMDEVKRYTTIDKVDLPRVEFSYHSPVGYGPGDAEMHLAADVLAGGKSSRLYKRLVVDEKLASDVSASQQGFPLAGVFQVDVYANPSADLDKVEKIMDEELARLVKDGPTSAELQRHESERELGFLQGLQSLGRKADKLNEYEYFWGEPNSFRRDLDRYRSATPGSVQEWCQKTLTPGGRVIIRVLPEEPEREASARDKRPADLAETTFAPPEPAEVSLKNGMKAYVWSRHDLPLVSVRMVSEPGGALDPAGEPGLAAIAARMLTEGAGDKDALAFSDALQSIGAMFGASADHETMDVSMTVLKRNMDKGLGLFGDAVRKPRFEQSDWDRVKRLTIDDLKQLEDNPRVVAGLVADRLLYGDANPYARPSRGTVSSVGAMNLDQAKRGYESLLEPSSSFLLIAGDVTPEEAKRSLDAVLGDWRGAASGAGAERRSTEFAIPHVSGLRVAIVDRPNATQTAIQFETPGVVFNDPLRIKRRLLNTILGGSFTSRLNQNLREAHGYTYGARSHWSMDISTGDFAAAAAVQAQSTGASLTEFFKEFDRLAKGDITDAEATKAKETLRHDMVSEFEGLNGLLGTASEYLTSKLAFSTVSKDMAEIESVTAAELNSLAKNAVALENGVLVLVGDKQLIMEQIKGLNLPAPVEVSATGEPVAKQ